MKTLMPYKNLAMDIYSNLIRHVSNLQCVLPCKYITRISVCLTHEYDFAIL